MLALRIAAILVVLVTAAGVVLYLLTHDKEVSALCFRAIQIRADLCPAGVRTFDRGTSIYARLGSDLAAMLKGNSRERRFQFGIR